METEKILNIVSRINDSIAQQLETVQLKWDGNLQLVYSTDGVYEMVEFLGQCIWSSEEDFEQWCDGEEALDRYIKSRIFRLVRVLGCLMM
jgi:hypothetical protein